MKIVIYDSFGTAHSTGIEEEDVNEVDVVVISGDEQLMVLMKNGKIEMIDASDFTSPRFLNTYDGSYIVRDYELSIWNRRKNSVEWLNDRTRGDFFD